MCDKDGFGVVAVGVGHVDRERNIVEEVKGFVYYWDMDIDLKSAIWEELKG